MNRKQLIILLVLVAIVGGAGLVLFKRNDESWSPSDTKLGQKLLDKFQVNDVARIHIKGDNKDLNLVKKDDLWRVEERGDYPANFSTISDFLLKAAELKITQVEPIGESQLERLELLEPSKSLKSGTLVELKDAKGNNLQAVLLGKKHVKKMERAPQFQYGGDEFADGRYVMLKSDPKNVILISDALSTADPKAESWLNKDFFKVEKLKSVSFVSTNATNSWKASRETENGSWSVADVKAGESFDTNKLAALGNSLNSPSFADVVANGKPEETGLDHPLLLTLGTFDQFTYTLKVGKKNAEGNYNVNVAVAAELPKERMPGKDEKPEDKTKLDKEFNDKKQALADKLKQEQALEKWTYLVPSWSLDPLLKARHELMVEKKEEPKADSADAEPIDPAAIPALKKAPAPKVAPAPKKVSTP